MSRRPRGNGPGEFDFSRFNLNDVTRFRGGPSRRGVTFFIVVLILFIVPLFIGPFVSFWTDLLWFRSISTPEHNLEPVYLRRYTAAFAAFVVFFFAFFIFAATNVWIASRPRIVPRVVDVGSPRVSPALPYRVVTAILLVLALFFGLAAGDNWDAFLRYLNAVPFGSTDPVFGQDIGFYFFTLPVLEFVRGWAMFALVVVAIVVIVAYAVRGAFDLLTGGFESMRSGARAALSLARPVRAHLSVLGALFLLLVAAGYQLDRYGLLFRNEGSFLTGAGYTSINARLPALTILTGIALIAAVLLIANVFARTIWLLGATVGVWLLAVILVGGVYPALVDRFVVQPAQLQQERPYIERHIAATRQAYGIDRATETSFDVKDQPTAEEVDRDLAALSNIRIWDHRPLQQSIVQQQALRTYYEFPDIDVIRAPVNGTTQELMAAARELNSSRVTPQSWVNVHLVFTHGYGAVAVPVSAVTPEGQPAFSLKDLPPQGQPEVTRPQIYYGQQTTQYVIVGTSADEFDYPKANTEQTTRYAGGGGIRASNLIERLIFASRFGDVNLLISTQLSDSSRLLFHRQVVERERLIAPFLVYDGDPYLAFMDGGLYWIHDAYTVGSRYPYAERTQQLNYVRNSVKVVTNAYDGSLTFYVLDPSEPVVATLSRIYPELFDCICHMPPAIRAQLRYPEDILRLQTTIYARFHVTDATVFYNGTDQWQQAREIYANTSSPQAVEPYYVITRLPGETQPEFVLFVPMTPNQRDNMVAWLAGRADGEHYGELRVLRFATDRTIYGPLQIEARIQQEPEIKSQTALLSQAGSNVIYGNLIVIPVGSSFIYIEPIFIQATSGSIPELRRVVLATQTKVVMRNTFGEALAALVQGATVPPVTTGPGPTPSPTPPPSPSASPGATPRPSSSPSQNASPEVQALVRSANDHYTKAQAALRNGDFATYGQEIAALQSDLQRLADLTGAR